MHITFDARKDAANVVKHGVSLALATQFEWTGSVVWPDERRPYGEERQCAIGYIGVRLYFVVYVERPEGRRIISPRKANDQEMKRYAKA